jgi:hypothetical protein
MTGKNMASSSTLTFKQFITEIDHDDGFYTKQQSHAVSSSVKVDDTWKHLLTLGDYRAAFKRFPKEWVVALTHKSKPILRLELEELTVRVPGGTLTGVISKSLSLHEEHRGKGLPLKLYQALIDNGQVLFSADSQTSGSRLLWEKLVKSNEAFVLASSAAAAWYSNRAKKHEGSPHLLLTGPLDKLNDEAYASSETRWVVVPASLPGLNKLRDEAIQL